MGEVDVSAVSESVPNGVTSASASGIEALVFEGGASPRSALTLESSAWHRCRFSTGGGEQAPPDAREGRCSTP
jgi:hypothetical protein